MQFLPTEDQLRREIENERHLIEAAWEEQRNDSKARWRMLRLQRRDLWCRVCCLAAMVLVWCVGCGSEPSDAARRVDGMPATIRATMPAISKADVWVVREQDRQDKFIFDKDSGAILDCKYHRKQYSLRARIIKVDLPARPQNEQEVRADIDSAYFALSPEDQIPGHPGIRIIRYIFDADDDGIHTLHVGQAWEITLTDDGGLLDLRPLDSDFVPFDSLFEEWEAQAVWPTSQPSNKQAGHEPAPGTLPAIDDRKVWRVEAHEAFENFDLDPVRGDVLRCKYRGKRFVFPVTVVNLDLPWKSASIAAEDDSVYFALRPQDAIPGHPDLRVIRYMFDGDGLGWHTFQIGQAWQVTLKEDGGLLDLCLPKGQGIWFNSLFQRAMDSARVGRIAAALKSKH